METILNSMCRCCASEGVYKDVKTSYTWMGEEEVYADMLREIFNVNLSTTENGEDGGICEVCITQLRNASNFKKQVLHTEEQFKKHVSNKLFKPNIVKVEAIVEEDNDSDDNNISAEEGYSGTEAEVPIKQEKEPKPRKRAAAKATTSRAKKAKSDNGESSSKHPPQAETTSNESKDVTGMLTIIDIQPCTELGTTDEDIKKQPEKPKYISNVIELHKSNIRTILFNSNATPIGRYGGIGYGCSFCAQQFETPMELKNHTLVGHKDDKMNFMENVPMIRFIVKLDITNLICALCLMSFDSLNGLVDHLESIHEKKFHKEIKNHIVPFKFGKGMGIKCVVCNNDHNNFKVLLEHMNTHFQNYLCNVCGGGFVNRKILKNHAARHKTGVFECSYCAKTFNTFVKKRDHERVIHVKGSLRSKCGYCEEKFSDYTKKNRHEVKVHGAKPVVLKCQLCEKTYNNRRSLNAHVKKYH